MDPFFFFLPSFGIYLWDSTQKEYLNLLKIYVWLHQSLTLATKKLTSLPTALFSTSIIWLIMINGYIFFSLFFFFKQTMIHKLPLYLMANLFAKCSQISHLQIRDTVSTKCLQISSLNFMLICGRKQMCLKVSLASTPSHVSLQHIYQICLKHTLYRKNCPLWA